MPLNSTYPSLSPCFLPSTPSSGQQPTRKISGADLASYQFPVDDDEEHDGDAPDGPSTPQHMPSLHKQPSASALKKSPSDSSVSACCALLHYSLQVI